MGARPSTAKRGGGGFLHEVDATFTDYMFTDQFNGEPFKPGKWSDGQDKQHLLFMIPEFLVDGADESVTTHLKVGNYEDYEVSDDGKTLTSPDGGVCEYRTNSQIGIFMASLTAGGFDELLLPDDPNSINLEAVIGTRLRLVQRDNEWMKSQGRKKKGKDGKEYSYKDLCVETVYSTAPAAKPAAKAKATKTTKTASPSKGNGLASSDDIVTKAVELIQGIVTARGGALTKAKLMAPILLSKSEDKSAIHKLASNDEWLSETFGDSYDAEKQVLTLQ